MNNIKAKVIIFIFIILLIIGLVIGFNTYKKYYFNGFEKATVKELSSTKFTRDNDIKYSEFRSYKIENGEFNDSTFYKEVEVTPNTPYRISCMVKTENVICENSKEDGGVVIGLLDTTEYSNPISGTNDWQKVEFMFNSKNRDKVTISFRLGGNNNNCTGTAWFSDMKLEKGISQSNKEWNIGCFIVDELNVTINGKEYIFKTNNEDRENARLNMERFKDDCYKFSNKQMIVNYEILEIKDPITTISYTDEHGYYLTYKDIKNAVYNTVKEKEYDHIFVVCRMEDDQETLTIPINDNWIGLGSMDLYGIGYSLIRINKNGNSRNYVYGISNLMPEEVYLHEFLHTLERNTIERGYDIPALHDNEKYGYKDEGSEGLMNWYKDYMSKNILDKDKNTYIGLEKIAYETQPPHSKNFQHALDMELNVEPKNIIEDILSIRDVLKKGK